MVYYHRLLSIPILLMLSVPIHAQSNNPDVVSRFEQALRSQGTVPNASLFAFPLTLIETAYEVGAGWCAPHYQSTPIKSWQQLQPYFTKMQKAGTAKPLSPGNNPSYYGFVGEGDCEHYWAVKLDSQSKMIISFVVDASNNAWDPSRKQFDVNELP